MSTVRMYIQNFEINHLTDDPEILNKWTKQGDFSYVAKNPDDPLIRSVKLLNQDDQQEIMIGLYRQKWAEPAIRIIFSYQDDFNLSQILKKCKNKKIAIAKEKEQNRLIFTPKFEGEIKRFFNIILNIDPVNTLEKMCLKYILNNESQFTSKISTLPVDLQAKMPEWIINPKANAACHPKTNDHALRQRFFSHLNPNLGVSVSSSRFFLRPNQSKQSSDHDLENNINELKLD